MNSERAIFIILFFVYLASVSVLLLRNKNTVLSSLFAEFTEHLQPTQFENPTLAYQILSQLDLYEPLNETVNGKQVSEVHHSFFSLKTDDEYCKKHRAYFVYNPEFIFKEKNFVSGFMRNSDLKMHWLPLIGGSDIMPHIHSRVMRTLGKKPMHDLRVDAQLFFFSNHLRRKVNKQFACTTQWFNHLPGQILSRKYLIAEAINEYKMKYETQPQCVETNKFFPKTWVLTDKTQCEQFFEEFSGPRYQALKKERGTVYFRKLGSGVHQGKGVFPVDASEERYLRRLYDNGAKCGEVNQNNLVQYAVHNPLLINGRKSDFRFYIFVASSNPLIVYANDGYFSISLNKFDKNSTSKSTMMTNYRLTQQLFMESKEQGLYEEMSENDMDEDTIWTFEKFQDYLLAEGLIEDENWLDNYFRKELKKVALHLVRLANHTLTRRSSLYEIYGVDMVMDEEFGMWFIEANANPSLENFPKSSEHVIKNMMTDAFEILFGLLRSRTKRIIAYVNGLTRDHESWIPNGEDVYLFNLERRTEEFKKVSQNYFEPEFEREPEGRMYKVLDENLSGLERYQYLLPEECF